jgi:hypothetical protein
VSKTQGQDDALVGLRPVIEQTCALERSSTSAIAPYNTVYKQESMVKGRC